MSRIKVRPGHRDANAHATQLAEATVEAWSGWRRNDNYALVLSAIAALSLINPNEHTHHELAEGVLELPPAELGEFIRSWWQAFAQARPDLLNPVWPLMEQWLSEEWTVSDEDLRTVHHTVGKAVQYDLFGLTAQWDRRMETDLLGTLLTHFRPKSALQGRGQFYTPPPVCDLMARMTIDDLQEGQSIMEPAAGTGGMLRAVAMYLVESGKNPHTMRWYANDIDPLAIACLAVNVQLWGLGPNVVLGCADALADPEWYVRAEAMRLETVELHQRLQAETALAKRVALMQRLISGDLDPVIDAAVEDVVENVAAIEPAAAAEPELAIGTTESGQAMLIF